MPSSGTSTPIDTSEPSDRSPSPQNPMVEKVATSSDSNVGPSKGRKPAWNVPSGTASPESAGPIMNAATWPVLAASTATTHLRSSPKSTSTASSSSTDDLKSLCDGAAPASVVRTYVSSPETMGTPSSQQPKANSTPNLTRRGSTGSENTHSPQQNHRLSRWAHGPNRRGNHHNNSNNYHYNTDNNNRGGLRRRDRGVANLNPSPRPQLFLWGNQVLATAPPAPPLSYAFGPSVHPPFYAPMGYDIPYGPYSMLGHVPISGPQMVTQIAPPDLFSTAELEKRSSILKQVEYYFSEDNLCHDDYLRRNMNDQGWVPISLIANFNRMRRLTNDLQLILESLNDSTVVEVQDNMVRRCDKWEKYLLPPQLQLEHAAIQMQGLNIGHGHTTSNT